MIKIATVGTSSITEQLIQAMQQCQEYEVVAVYSRSLEKGKTLAERYGIAKVYDDYQTMLKDSKIHFVYIASPNSLHATHAYEALRHGKHVIVEKPITANLQEFIKLKEFADAKQLKLFEAITILHQPNFKVIQEHVSSLGQIRMIQMNMSQYSSKYASFKEGQSPNVFTLEYAGGALMDINVYNIHFLLALFPNYKKVMYTPVIQQGIDTSGVLTILYDDFIASMVGSKDNIGKNFVQLQGEKGYLYVEGSPSLVGVSYLVPYKQEPIVLTDIKEHNVYYYEMKRIAEIFHSKDEATYQSLLQHSYRVITCLQQAKEAAGLVFENDKKETV